MENKNGQGIFYGVIGVATLVVAIIGATFAYFSATVDTTYDNPIGGNTLTVGGNSLSVVVSRETFAEKKAPSDNLVPANMGSEDMAAVNAALGANCENHAGDYTGCHLYKITVHSDNTLSGVTLKTQNMKVTGRDAADWKYIIFQGSQSAATSAMAAQAFAADPGSTFNIINAGNLTGGQGAAGDTVYYMLVYIKNDTTASQNAGDAADVTGSYQGQVSLEVAGEGKIAATFSA